MRRLAVVAGGVVLVAAACSSGASSTSPATTATTVAATIPPTTTTRPVELPEVVLPDVDIDDAGEAFRLIMAFVDDLGRNPQPELLARYYDPECATYRVVVDSFNRLAENEWRWAAVRPTEVTELLPVAQNESGAQIVATYTTAAAELVDRDGRVVGTEPEQTHQRGISLTRSEEHGWRICDSVAVIDP